MNIAYDNQVFSQKYHKNQSFEWREFSHEVEVKTSILRSYEDFCFLISIVFNRRIFEENDVLFFLLELALHRRHCEFLHFIIFHLNFIVSFSILQPYLNFPFLSNICCNPNLFELLLSNLDVQAVFLDTTHVFIIKHDVSIVFIRFVENSL
jgi:hypothetical protein